MRPIRRLTFGAATLAALCGLLVSTAAAGNFAEVTMLDGAAQPPVAGESRELAFQLLQHGVTPVDFGAVEVIATLAGADEEITVAAVSEGGGRWTATLTFPTAGDWQIQVNHSEFATSPPTTLTVTAAAAAAATATSGANLAFLLLAAMAVLIIAGLAAVRLTRKDEPATIASAG